MISELPIGEVPEPVIIGGVTLAVLAVWVLVMILLSKVAFRFWTRINTRVYWFRDLVVPESPILRFGGGLIVLMFLFVIGPLVGLQYLDIGDSSDGIVEGAESDEPDSGENKTQNDTSDVSESVHVVNSPTVDPGADSAAAKGPPAV